MPFPTLLLKLLVAHLAGDFPFQPDAWARNKRRPSVLMRHLGVHAALLAIVLATEPASARMWGIGAALIVVHGLIDLATGRPGTKRPRALMVDQALHILSLIGACIAMQPAQSAAVWARIQQALLAPQLFIILAGIIAGVWVGAYVVGTWVEAMAAGLPDSSEDARHGLQEAGRRIGMLERLLIFIALVFGQAALAGFVIGVKAVLRLPEAAERKSRSLAEYYLLGTLASAAWAVVIALITRGLLDAVSRAATR